MVDGLVQWLGCTATCIYGYDVDDWWWQREDVVKPHRVLLITEMVKLIGSFLPLFDRRFETEGHRFVDIWDPKPLLRVAFVNKDWNQIMTEIL
ncbi:hypothetical protein BGX23_002928 [Mortierella sp. AD031]|nr:hypothetical protein BGX23_002928 [Mortierella sp. AD031]